MRFTCAACRPTRVFREKAKLRIAAKNTPSFKCAVRCDVTGAHMAAVMPCLFCSQKKPLMVL